MSNLFYMVKFIIEIFIILLVATSQIRNYLLHFLFNFELFSKLPSEQIREHVKLW